MKVTGICLFARFYWISNPNLPWLWKNDYLRSVLRDQADRWHPSAATFPQNLFQQPHSGEFSSEAVLPKPEPAGEKKRRNQLHASEKISTEFINPSQEAAPLF